MKLNHRKLVTKQVFLRSLAGFFLAFMCLVITGCSPLTKPVDGSDSESMEEYADELFRRQNQASSTVMMLSEEDLEQTDYSILIEAEQQMHMACKPFNDYASMISDGLKPGVLLRNKIYRALDECDSATQKLEILLDDQE